MLTCLSSLEPLSGLIVLTGSLGESNDLVFLQRVMLEPISHLYPCFYLQNLEIDPSSLALFDSFIRSYTLCSLVSDLRTLPLTCLSGPLLLSPKGLTLWLLSFISLSMGSEVYIRVTGNNVTGAQDYTCATLRQDAPWYRATISPWFCASPLAPVRCWEESLPTDAVSFFLWFQTSSLRHAICFASACVTDSLFSERKL